MYNLQLSPQQLEIRDTVRDFIAKEVKPLAQKPDRMEARERPLLVDVLAQASRMGLRTLALSEEAGGAGADNLTCCIVTEELAAGDPDIAAVLAQTSTLAWLMFNCWMTPSQRERFLPPFLADEGYHLALAEQEAGDDDTLGINYHHPATNDTRPKTTAARADDHWTINGAKAAVANAPLAKLFAVQVATASGVSMLLVPRDTPGLAVRDNGEGRRWSHGAYGAVTFSDCRVPAQNLLGIEGRSPLAAAGGRGITQDQALNLGIGRVAYEAALDYAQLRVQGGRRIIEHQAIGSKLAEVAMRLEVARTAIWRAAWASDHSEAIADGSLPDLPLASIAKVFSSETIYQATKDAAECFGAMGVMRDMPLQKYVHDALVCLHSGRSNSDAKLRIAEALAGYQRPAVTSVHAGE
jgi:alkylation response protein AidB-like acyl-CoA dehydrogenase